MTYGFEINKDNGESSYVSGDQNLIYLGKIVVNVPANIYPSKEDVLTLGSLGNLDAFGFDKGGVFGNEVLNRFHATAVKIPYYLDVLNNTNRNITQFTQYGIDNLIFFVKPLGNDMRFGVVKTSQRIGLILEGFIPQGSIHVYVFSPRLLLASEFNTSYGINVFDTDSRCIYTSNVKDLSLVYSSNLSSPSFSFWAVDPEVRGSGATRLMSSKIDNGININHAFNVNPLTVQHDLAAIYPNNGFGSVMLGVVTCRFRQGRVDAILRYGFMTRETSMNYPNNVPQYNVASGFTNIIGINPSIYDISPPFVDNMSLTETLYF